MFICNLKINVKKIWKVTLFALILLITVLMIFVLVKIFNVKDSSNSIEITSDSYTSFLKDCHENIDNYVGKNIRVTGYVYRLPDFTDNQFVVARTMIIDGTNQSVVVGILAQVQSAEKYSTGSWVEVSGNIIKGNYNGEIPVLEISNIKNTNSPENEFVYLPR